MSDFIRFRWHPWAPIAVIAGIGRYIGIDLIENPDSTLLDVTLNLAQAIPLVLTSAGIVILLQITSRQRKEHLQVIHDLKTARTQGQRWPCCS